MFLLKRFRRLDVALNVFFELAIDLFAGLMKIDRAVLAVLKGAGGYAGDVFREGRFDRPNKGMNGAQHENRRFLVPTGIAQSFAAVGGGMRLKRPSRVGAEFGRNAKFAEDGL